MPPLRLAIVGGGPSAFYVASRLLSRIEGASVHVYDKLWAPHGLVRYGVAPDHPEVKNCSHKFDEVAQDKRFKFFGNVHIEFPHTESMSSKPRRGVEPPAAHRVPISLLYPHYTHLLLASGAPSPVLHPMIPPSECCIPALDIVHWYTAHPCAPPPPPLSRISHLTILGMGNVSLDVARILLSPVDRLIRTEIRDDVLETLSCSTLKQISVLGRRGPLEAKFGNKEVRELMTLDGVGFLPLDSSALDFQPGVKPNRQQTRFLSLLKAGSTTPFLGSSRSWDLQFYQSPTELAPASSTNRDGHQYNLKISHTALSPVTPADSSIPKAETVAVSTHETSIKETDLLVTSLGQLTAPLSLHGPAENLPLENLKTTANRVYTSTNRLIKNVYTSGWAAIGARGVLNTTLMDAYAVTDMILSDSEQPDFEKHISPPISPHPPEPPIAILPEFPELQEEVPPLISEATKDGRITTYDDWKVVDNFELERGKERGKDRVKLVWSEVAEKGLIRR